METIVAAIYADKASQLERIGFKSHQISEVHPNSKLETFEPYFAVTSRYSPMEYTHSQAMRLALNFLAHAKNRHGMNRAGLDTSLEFENEYSPVCD